MDNPLHFAGTVLHSEVCCSKRVYLIFDRDPGEVSVKIIGVDTKQRTGKKKKILTWVISDICSHKRLVVFTRYRCQLISVIQGKRKTSLVPALSPITKARGHALIAGHNSYQVCLVSVPSFSSSLSISGMRYYLNLCSLLTLSVDVPGIAYPPYSLRVQSRRARFVYDILLSPSAGEEAEIHISAIETLSEAAYSILSVNGKELTNISKGTRASGCFILPEGCSDVGLHIWTPLGFSADIGENPATCLAKFIRLEMQ